MPRLPSLNLNLLSAWLFVYSSVPFATVKPTVLLLCTGYQELFDQEERLRSRTAVHQTTLPNSLDIEPSMVSTRQTRTSIIVKYMPFVVPETPISIEDLAAMTYEHKRFGDAYISSLNHSSDASRHSLDICAALPQQPSPVIIRVQLPAEGIISSGSEELSWYYEHNSVSFHLQGAATEMITTSCSFVQIKPTLLFLCRAMFLFFQETKLYPSIGGDVFVRVIMRVLKEIFGYEVDEDSEAAVKLGDRIIGRFCE